MKEHFRGPNNIVQGPDCAQWAAILGVEIHVD